MAEFARFCANSAIATFALVAKLCKFHICNIFAPGKFFRPVKGKLIWTKSLQDLQNFVEEILNKTDGVFLLSRRCKAVQIGDIDLRWYPETQTITLNGKLKDEIGEILYSAAQISGKLTNKLKKRH